MYMKNVWELFALFAKIGLFTFGGGYAMLPLIEREIVEHKKWIDRKEFLDLVAVAQSSSGIFAVNLAIFVGYKLKGIWGSFAAASGAVLPSFVIIVLIALFFRRFQENPVAKRIFWGIRPAVVALIAVPVFNLAKAANLSYKNIWIPVSAALLIWLAQISPVYIILAAAVGGLLHSRFMRRIK